MSEIIFSHQILGLVNSIIHPLLSSLILLDDLIREEFEDIDTYGKLVQIDQQLQSAVEHFLDLRSLTFLELEGGEIYCTSIENQ